jgi:hypothetical protein
VSARTAALAALCLVAVALAGCTNPSPSSPVAAIPKLIVDYQDNVTRLYLTSVNADVRYGNLSIVLTNENLTHAGNSSMILSNNRTFNTTKAFALIAATNLSYFILNATADESGKHYFYNATVHIAPRPPDNPSDPVIYQAYIVDTTDGTIRPEALPFRHVLAEG